ncbi:hypothetical protein JTE90_016056 [Oedothorax gibbosus]|uniref:Uncharacterized protein n=1 Tax=Oedothorax gibbosus TaxID=931172 RepID=A0AAV6TKD7_9ARAC|nr:hypothetical protein JTE90_016056 [Oedothorax gibbosus]
MHCIPAGMILKTPPWLKNDQESRTSAEEDPATSEEDLSVNSKNRHGSIGLHQAPNRLGVEDASAVRTNSLYQESSEKLLVSGKNLPEFGGRFGRVNSKSEKDQGFPDTQFFEGQS